MVWKSILYTSYTWKDMHVHANRISDNTHYSLSRQGHSPTSDSAAKHNSTSISTLYTRHGLIHVRRSSVHKRLVRPLSGPGLQTPWR